MHIVTDSEISNVVIDSRKVVKGSVFFAINGNNVNGNDFVSDAILVGATLIVFTDKDKYDSIECNKVLVTDAKLVLLQLAKLFFKRYKGKKIFITGSFGKTSSKELLTSILATKYNVYSTEGNYNNELGVSITGVNIDMNADFIIIEAGSNSVGEIECLADIVKPDISIVTNIGHAHIGRFGSYENIIKEKLSVVRAMKSGSMIILPYEFLDKIEKNGEVTVYTFGQNSSSDIELIDAKYQGSQIEFRVSGDETVYKLSNSYLHMATNALPLIYFAKQMGMNSQEIFSGIASFKQVKGRGEIIKIGEMTIIDDTYNAGVESIVSSVKSLSLMDSDKKRYAVIGEMAEIEGYEAELYQIIVDLSIVYENIDFYLVGESYKSFKELSNRKIYLSKDSVIEELVKIQNGLILIKASRSREFETIINKLHQKLGD